MSIKNAVIVIDSGFSQEVVGWVKNLIGFYDLNSGIAVTGAPLIKGDQAQFVLQKLCADPLKHGSIVLRGLLHRKPDCAFVLVRAFDDAGTLFRTRWSNGQVDADGWVEAYLWARQLCANRGFTSVANLSFGGYSHAQDGSGWESFKLASAVGSGKSGGSADENASGKNLAGHVLVAATGPGDKRGIHCSFTANENTVVHGYQGSTSVYNLWVDRNVSSTAEHCHWHLLVKMNGREVAQHQGRLIPRNIWNDRQQLTFVLEGEGNFEFSITPASAPAATVRDLSAQVSAATSVESSVYTPTRFDIFVAQGEDACFFDHYDADAISEPACLSQVIAVGLRTGSYGKCTVNGIAKPEVKLAGGGPISFRIAEVTALVASLLEADPTMDIAQVRQKVLDLHPQ